MAKIPDTASSARICGTASGMNSATTANQAASLALRSTGTAHSLATRSLGSARLTQNLALSVSTSQISEEMPPLRRRMLSGAAEVSPARRRKETIASSIGRALALADRAGYGRSCAARRAARPLVLATPRWLSSTAGSALSAALSP